MFYLNLLTNRITRMFNRTKKIKGKHKYLQFEFSISFQQKKNYIRTRSDSANSASSHRFDISKNVYHIDVYLRRHQQRCYQPLTSKFGNKLNSTHTRLSVKIIAAFDPVITLIYCLFGNRYRKILPWTILNNQKRIFLSC